MIKNFFYDLETTGTNPRRNGIHQISGILDVDGLIKERIDFKVQPNPAAVIEDAALEVGGVTREQIMAYRPMGEVYNELLSILTKYVNRYDRTDKIFLVGYNNRKFDDDFLRAFFKQNGDEYFGSYFYADSHDILVIASWVLRRKRVELPNMKLPTVAKYFGFEVADESLHDASYDLELTRRIYYKLCDLLSETTSSTTEQEMSSPSGTISVPTSPLHT